MHFGKFVSAYCCTGERFFDIHPPHAKLLIALAGKLSDYDGRFPFKTISEPYNDTPVLALRTVPALFGTLLPLIIFLLLLQLGVSDLGAFVGGVAVLFDNALLLQTRLIALDGILLVATFGALSFYLWARKQHKWLRVAGMAGAGALCGLAVGTKFTGLGALALIGLLVFWVWILKRASWRQTFTDGIIIVVMAVIIYFGGWYLHFVLLTLPGSGDVWGLPTGNFWVDIMALQKTMMTANYNLTAGHPYSSVWWTWPLMLRPVFYWNTGQGYLYFLGNPAVWWTSFVLFMTAVISWLFDKWRGKDYLGEGAIILLAGYVISFGPLVRVPRALFLYHYLTPLLFSLLLAVLWVDKVLLEKKPEATRAKIYGTAILVIVIFFMFFSSYTFGFPISEAWHKAVSWFPGWR